MPRMTLLVALIVLRDGTNCLCAVEWKARTEAHSEAEPVMTSLRRVTASQPSATTTRAELMSGGDARVGRGRESGRGRTGEGQGRGMPVRLPDAIERAVFGLAFGSPLSFSMLRFRQQQNRTLQTHMQTAVNTIVRSMNWYMADARNKDSVCVKQTHAFEMRQSMTTWRQEAKVRLLDACNTVIKSFSAALTVPVSALHSHCALHVQSIRQ
jgi:hypothetical protein